MLADGFEDPIGLAIDSKHKVAYVADLGGHIWEVPAPGHPDTTARIAIDVGFPVTGLNLIEGS